MEETPKYVTSKETTPAPKAGKSQHSPWPRPNASATAAERPVRTRNGTTSSPGASPPADVCERFVRKGTQLYIEGRLRTRKYTDRNGQEKYTTEINVDTLQLLGRRDGDGAGYPADQQGGGYQPRPQQPAYQQPAPAQPQQPVYQQPAPQEPAAPAVDEGPTDDLPF